MKFHKYEALGNDYLVLEGGVLETAGGSPSASLVRRVCDRHRGVGSDGVLVGDIEGQRFTLRIFNPDGSEAEKSGNGLRIFARYLRDRGLVGSDPFEVVTKGGRVACQVRDSGRTVFVEMGRASFDSTRIPVAGPAREVLNEPLDVGNERIRFTAVTVGNPHCVIHCDSPSPDLARRLGPLIETHPTFPNRTNVQFVKVIDSKHLRIEIWERGAGYTSASGSSSCAAAAASHRLGLCDGDVKVSMPGGALRIGVSADFHVTMLGPVSKVADGVLAPEFIDR